MPPLERQESEISTPVNRIRWASKRETGKSGLRKRDSILKRLHHIRNPSGERKRAASSASKRASTATAATGAAGSSASRPGTGDGASRKSGEEVASQASSDQEEQINRRVYFNIPLPEEERDENGEPTQHFARNKIRTAKYTPISFLPKNLYYQFHNIANLYFLFIIILGVCFCSVLRLILTIIGF
jgi:phospholipid-translocating ATPase